MVHVRAQYVLTMYPTSLMNQFPEIEEAWKAHGVEFSGSSAEVSELCGALLMAGREDLCRKVLQSNEEAFRQYDGRSSTVEPGFIDEVYKMGEVGYDCLPENAHVHPCRNVYPEAGRMALKRAGEKIGDTLKEICFL